MNSKRYDDLSSLFLPDILQTVPSQTNPIKSEPNTNDYTRTNQNNLITDFNTFINNNNFITSKQKDQEYLDTHHSHYSNFIPPEINPHHNHNHVLSSTLYPNSNTQAQHKPLDSSWFNNDIDDNNYGEMLETSQYQQYQHQQQLQQLQQFMPMNFNYPSYYSQYFEGQQQSQDPQQSDPQAPQQQPQPQVPQQPQQEIGNIEPIINVDKKKKTYKKARNRMKLNNGINVDYNANKLTKMLDFKCRKLNYQDYKIIDKNGNEIQINFKGFLNGKFLTNDFDNSNYIYSILEDSKDVDYKNDLKKKIIKTNPKVISCYRRNFIQLLMNFNLSGFKDYNPNDPKIIKIQTNEFGYTTTRVIKWFKIDITANSNISKSQNVSLIIGDDAKDKEKDKKHDLNVNNKDYVNPQPINSTEHIITLNNSEISNDEIDNFFTVKKLQFKNATPNNGNFTFQNYYYLKIKLSAIVADLYYDDYIEEDFSITNPDNSSRNEINLFELESEPIIVRGRNPSFYAERKDLLVKSRSSISKESYKNSGKLNIDTSNDFKFEEINNNNELDDINESIESESTDEESNKRLKSLTPALPPNYNKKLVPPVIFNANLSKKDNLLSLFLNDDEVNNYKYFPISNVYYLPPINVVYFPHGAHQHKANHKNSSPIEDVSRKSSNVYFK